MDEPLNFSFQIPKPIEGPLIELSIAEIEKLLIKRLDRSPAGSTQALWELAHFYKNTKQHEKALERLRELIQKLPDPESKAECVFTMGQSMEQIGDYVAAIRYYKEAFALEPVGNFTWYFIHNNLGFSLNTLGRFSAGEEFCRKAIEIDFSKPNGHKNLGMSLAAQGRYPEAARAFVAATQANAADARAFRLLEQLIKEHSELEYEFENDLKCCRNAVEAVSKKVKENKPLIYTGWRKQLFLLKLKARSLLGQLKIK